MTAQLVVQQVGLLATVQDEGRFGLAHLAVSRCGALDQPALRLANRLVGNSEGAAGIEITLLGAQFRVTAGRWLAVTGADAEIEVAGRPAAGQCAEYAPAGGSIRIGPARRGVRSYLAVAGGIDEPPVLGSRSTDTLSGIGPEPLAAGRVLQLGPVAGTPPAVDLAPAGPLKDMLDVRLLPGPREAWFEQDAIGLLTSTPYRVTTGDRIGIRLAGPALRWGRPDPLPSEGIVLGSVQVPPGGQPLIFLADHPTTGGYPVIGVVHPADLAPLAQLAPGSSVRFHRLGRGPG